MTREDDLEALANANGWSSSIEDHDDIASIPFHFFANGVAGVVMNTIEGERDGRDFVAFDYEWRTPSLGMLQAESTFDSSCVLTALPAECPELMVSHETTSHWLSHPRHHTVFTSERPDFARAVRVTTTHPAFAAAVFDATMEAWLLETGADDDLCWEIAGPWLMLFTRQRPPEDVTKLIDAAVAFVQHIPPPAFDGLPIPAV
jgi:hypothetical protein